MGHAHREHRQTWDDAIARYDEFAGSGWEWILPFRELVAALRADESTHGLFAVTSHAMLMVSPYSRHPDWCEGRRVTATPNRDGTVHVQYFPVPSLTPDTSYVCPVNGALAGLRDLCSRL